MRDPLLSLGPCPSRCSAVKPTGVRALRSQSQARNAGARWSRKPGRRRFRPTAEGDWQAIARTPAWCLLVVGPAPEEGSPWLPGRDTTRCSAARAVTQRGESSPPSVKGYRGSLDVPH